MILQHYLSSGLDFLAFFFNMRSEVGNNHVTEILGYLISLGLDEFRILNG